MPRRKKQNTDIKDSNNVRFYDEVYIAELLGVERRLFHLEIKPIILSDFPEILKELKTLNLDIGLDKNNIVYLSDIEHKKIISTKLRLFCYI